MLSKGRMQSPSRSRLALNCQLERGNDVSIKEETVRLEVVQAGEEVLRAQARELSRQEILSDKTQELIEHMKETLRHAPGVGLAAPQVGFPIQLAVIEDREEYHKKLTAEQLSERERRPVPFHVLINPHILRSEDPSVEFFEGCLSVSGYAAIVPRARAVTVEYLDESAQTKRVEAVGWYARILQHEIDHLAGILYIDRMKTRTWTTLANVERYWKDVSTSEVRARLRDRPPL
jgi:peptide deformylase